MKIIANFENWAEIGKICHFFGGLGLGIDLPWNNLGNAAGTRWSGGANG